MYIHQQTERHIHVDVLTVDSYMWLFLVTQPLAIAKIDMAVSTDCVMSKPKNIKKKYKSVDVQVQIIDNRYSFISCLKQFRATPKNNTSNPNNAVLPA